METPKPFLLFSLNLLLIIPIATAGLKLELEHELESATSALRSAGYNLFPNAIATTDLRYRFLSSTSPNTTTKFTLFSPPDSFLFSLDFSSQAQGYFLSLLRHVSPLRLTYTDLLNLANRSDGLHMVPSLLPGHSLRIRTSPLVLPNGTASNSLAVNGVKIVAPDLFVGSGMTVHGLDRIIIGDDQDSESSLGNTEGISGYLLNRDGVGSFGSIQMLMDNDHQKGGKKLGHEARKEGNSESGHDRFFKFGSRFSG